MTGILIVPSGLFGDGVSLKAISPTLNSPPLSSRTVLPTVIGIPVLPSTVVGSILELMIVGLLADTLAVSFP